MAVQPQTKARLLNLLDGNQEACRDLVNKTNLENPGLDDQACWEKAISNFVKDKGNKFRIAWGFNFF